MNKTLGYGDRAAVGDTVAAPSGKTVTLTGAVRSTVLPRVEKSEGAKKIVREEKPRYQEVRPLGAGGQAEVTLTQDHDIDRVVAIKRLLPENRDEGSILRFTEEIRTIGRLEHPNIVPIHDVGVDAEGHLFFVMKYVEGETLESVITKLRDGDPAYVARYTHEYRQQICNEILRAVEHAHGLGILHRDLKPANVIVGALGEVVVMDWGLATKAEEAETGVLMGTPAYMSPEQAAGKPLDARSDIYSLAVMFYELFALKHPRKAGGITETVAAVMHEPIGMMQLIGDFTAAKAPAAMMHFVRHGLDRDPAKRYQSVAEMRARVELARDGNAPVECPLTFSKRVTSMLSRGIDRHPMFILFGLPAMMLAPLLWLVLR